MSNRIPCVIKDCENNAPNRTQICRACRAYNCEGCGRVVIPKEISKIKKCNRCRKWRYDSRKQELGLERYCY